MAPDKLETTLSNHSYKSAVSILRRWLLHGNA